MAMQCPQTGLEPGLLDPESSTPLGYCTSNIFAIRPPTAYSQHVKGTPYIHVLYLFEEVALCCLCP